MSEIGLASSLTDQELKNAIVEKQSEVDSLNIDLSASKKSKDNICKQKRRFIELLQICLSGGAFYSCRSNLGYTKDELAELVNKTTGDCINAGLIVVRLEEKLTVALKELDVLENELNRRTEFSQVETETEQIIETVKSQSKQPYFIYAVIGVVIIAVLLIRKKHK